MHDIPTETPGVSPGDDTYSLCIGKAIRGRFHVISARPIWGQAPIEGGTTWRP
jgi:hypothetical protein